MAMPIPLAAQTNSMSAVMTTALSLPANLAKSTGAPTVAPSGTMLIIDAAEQRMNRTPTAIAFPLYDFIVSRLRCLNTGTRRQGDAPVSYTHLRAHETRHDLVCRLLRE